MTGYADFLGAVLRVTTPILLAALGVLVSDRAGVINIGAEGAMMCGAFAGVVASAATGSAWLGLLGAVVAGMAAGALLAFAVLVLRADLVLSGIAMNLAAASLTALVLFALTGDKGMSGSLASKVLPDILGQHVLSWAALAGVPLIGVVLTRTPFGLRLRAVGENAEAASVAGLRVGWVRLIALMLSGALAAMGGAFLSMGSVSWFATNMTAGRGYIAIAAEAMSRGTASGTLLASLLLGAAGALATELQGGGIPTELVQGIPYLAPVAALVLRGVWWGRRAK